MRKLATVLACALFLFPATCAFGQPAAHGADTAAR